jgi:hypothetical protein
MSTGTKAVACVLVVLILCAAPLIRSNRTRQRHLTLYVTEFGVITRVDNQTGLDIERVEGIRLITRGRGEVKALIIK